MIDRRTVLAASAAVLAPQPSAAGAGREPGPGRGPWVHGRPEDHGLSTPALEKAAEAIGSTGERQGLVIVRDGVIVFERYWATPYARATPDWRNVSFSSGK
ncbi:MAG: hypothetical protein WDA06_10945, partial [Phenylobacterium sp.]